MLYALAGCGVAKAHFRGVKRIFNPARRKRVLIVDSDAVLARIYGDQLGTQGFDVEVACNREVRPKVEAGGLDLVILDFSTPGTENVEILEQIRANAETQALPVIVLLNAFLGPLVRAARRAGATKCLTKAECTRQNFLRTVREVLAIGVGYAMPRATATEGPADIEATMELTLIASAVEALASLRVSHHAFLKTEEEDLRRVELCEMRRQVHFLTGLAGLAGFYRVALLASTLEALFIDLHARPKNIKASVLRTISQTVDRMGSFLDQTSTPANASVPLKVLVVDDEMMTRKTISSAMEQAGLMVVGLSNPTDARRLLGKDHFDLIFLDVEMPGLNGIDLCAHIRKTPANRATPIVFVTGHSDFDIRAQSILSGGTDFIAKPFISVELAVKALTWLFEKNQTTSTAAVRNDSLAKTENAKAELSAGFATLGLSGAFA
jgi:CheY-like chemotaxis protein